MIKQYVFIFPAHGYMVFQLKTYCINQIVNNFQRRNFYTFLNYTGITTYTVLMDQYYILWEVWKCKEPAVNSLQGTRVECLVLHEWILYFVSHTAG